MPARSPPTTSASGSAGEARAPGLVKIGELARRLGLTTRSLRYWEGRGLLPSPRRSAGGIRLYGPEHAVAARGIQRLKCAGFTLEKIESVREHMTGTDTALAGMAMLTGSLTEQETRLRQSISELQSMLDELTAARRCMGLCDGCNGKAFDSACIDCLDEASDHAMPDCLSAVLQAACQPTRKTE